jgi:hypothetical protein
MGYPQDGCDDYSESEVRQMYRNGEISKDEARNLNRSNGQGSQESLNRWLEDK